MFCGQCGAENPDNGKFCAGCGSALGSARAADAQPATPAASRTAVPVDFVEPTYTSGKAVASLLFGFLFFTPPTAAAAVILGHMALRDIRKSAGKLKGHGIAVGGLVLGYMGLAIVPVAVIAALIAIPHLRVSRLAANEAAAVSSLRTIDVAALTYAGTYGNGYPADLNTLTGAGTASCDHAGLIAGTLASEEHDGYLFTYHATADGTAPGIAPKAKGAGCSASGASGFAVSADPVTPGTTGNRSFYADQTGIIRVETGGAATAKSAPLQ